jgi:asparagine synthase (glutamine-hydrolysing)
MNDLLVHRGPDGEGFYADGRVNLAMRRLAIIDLKSGQQPITNETGDVWVVFNGEIYNYQDLRETLSRKGHVFRTSSDTETIVHAYEEYGLDFLDHLRGMFAIALWDKTRRQLVVARDRVGEKPLFYALEGNELVFGSEIKAMLPRLGTQDVNHAAIDLFLACGFVPAPQTFFRNIHKLPAGHFLLWRDNRLEVRRYWELPRAASNAVSRHATPEELGAELREAVRLCLKSDVEVGAFLSGGLDSSLLTALMKEQNADVKTFCVGYGGGASGFNELHYAKTVAEHLGTDHHELIVDAKSTIDLMPAIIRSYDEPHGEPTSILVHILCEFASRYVKVAVGGTGADEIFYGYPRHKGLNYLAWYRKVPGFIREGLVRPLVSRLPESTEGSRTVKRIRRFVDGASHSPEEAYMNWIALFPPEQRRALLGPETLAATDPDAPAAFMRHYLTDPESNRHLMDRITLLDVAGYLPEFQLCYMDRMSMANSLEVRAPFCDYRLVEFVTSLHHSERLRGNTSKHILKQFAVSLLPESIVHRSKVGFDSPIGHWLKHDLSGFARSFLAPGEVDLTGLLSGKAVFDLLDEHQSGRKDYSLHLWSILAIECWFRMYFERSVDDHECAIEDLRGAA